MTDVDRLLADAFEDLGRHAPHDPDLAGSVRRRARRRTAVAGSALAVLLVAGTSTAVLAGRSGDGTAPPAAGASTAAAPPAATGCPAPETGVLPEWAWGGFSDPEAGGVPFVRGAEGDIVAILFGPLLSPPVPDRGNKILWVPRVYPPGPTPLVIDARLDGTTEVVRRELPQGPGPSGVDLPKPGCWHLQLRWGGATDSLSLRYTSP